MGMFSGTVFIWNEKHQSKEDLLTEFQQYMEKSDYFPADAEHAEKNFCFAFPQGSWFALVSNPEELRGKGNFCAEAFQKYAVSAELVDSDFVELLLFQPDGTCIDRKYIGTPYWEEEEKSTNIQQWEKFLSSGNKPEDLEKALQREEIFAEDAFNAFAMCLDMDISPLWLEKDSPQEEMATILSFRKK